MVRFDIPSGQRSSGSLNTAQVFNLQRAEQVAARAGDSGDRSADVHPDARRAGVRALRDAAQDVLRGLPDVPAEINAHAGGARLVLAAPPLGRPHRRVPYGA